MGMSSSQARLLHLTARMHQIEYKAAKLEAQKLQMANESRRVYDDYLEALDATKIQLRTINTDGSPNYIDATYNNLVAAGYSIEFEGLQGKFIPDADYDRIHDLYALTAPNRNYFIALYTNRITTSDNKASDNVYEIYTAAQLKAVTSGNSYRLMSNVELDTTFGDLSSINLDGNGYTITVTANSTLFNCLTNSDVYNLKVVNNNCTANSIFANKVTGTSNITNIFATGNINAPTTSGIGGCIRNIDGSSVKVHNCTSDINITGAYGVGGFACNIQNGAEIVDCISRGSIQGTRACGGFTAWTNTASISNTVSYTDVTINHTVNEALDSGAFCSAAGGTSTFTNCSTYGSMTNTSNISGVSETHTIGGFAGATSTNATLTFTNCDSYSNVTSNQDYVAGFISCINPNTSVTITGCNTNGSLSTGVVDAGGQPKVAGLIYSSGASGSTVEIINCASSSSSELVYNAGSNVTINSSSNNTTKSNNNTAAGASLSVTTKLDSADEIAAGILYDEYEAGLLHKDSEADMYSLSAHKDDSTWLTNMINWGFLYLFKTDKDNNKYQVSVATDTGLREVDDEKNLRKAEAKYEADMRKIDMKDRKFDTDLAALDAERNAIKSEMDTLKNVAKDNVERTFKLFS